MAKDFDLGSSEPPVVELLLGEVLPESDIDNRLDRLRAKRGVAYLFHLIIK
jgi:hypothetical protein